MAEALRIAVLGFTLPPGRFATVTANDEGMPIQTQRFGASLLTALRLSGAELLMVSAAPVTDYPHNSQIVFRYQHSSHEGVGYLELGFLNLTAIKHVTRFISAVARALPAMRQQGTQVLVVHGVHSPFLATALVARALLGAKIAVVMTDPPNVAHAYDTLVSRGLKHVDSLIIKCLVKRFDGVIALTEALATDFAPGVPYLIMEGIAPGGDSIAMRYIPGGTRDTPGGRHPRHA